jgi:cystathionine beta-lyase family protein involved in aluminum resistance
MNAWNDLLAREFEIPARFLSIADEAESATAEARRTVRDRAGLLQARILGIFTRRGVGEHHFCGTTGYGYHDGGRELLDGIVADFFEAEAAALRWQLVSGTHAISCLLFGNLRPGDTLVSVTGMPYDTLHPVIGRGEGWRGTLGEWGIRYREIPLLPSGDMDVNAFSHTIDNSVRAVFIQRSCGYTWRPSLTVAQCGEVIRRLRSINPRIIIIVDNCYGEMVETSEPIAAGADLVAGSLIKNLGGTIAPTGGYMAGGREYVARAVRAMTAPGIDGRMGATLGMNRLLYQGLFAAPMVVGHALEGAIWAADFMERLGFETLPRWDSPRTDIIQAFRLGSVGALRAFCRGIQNGSPVDSGAIPEEVRNPGYRDPIIMAGGTFVQGSSLELSADGPVREPYAVYLQGGISYHHVKAGVLCAVRELAQDGFI